MHYRKGLVVAGEKNGKSNKAYNQFLKKVGGKFDALLKPGASIIMYNMPYACMPQVLDVIR